MPFKVGQASRPSMPGGPPARRSDETNRTATIERIADPRSLHLEAVWNGEWERNLWNAAVARVKGNLKPKQFQMFDLYTLKEWPVKEVARALGVSTAHVYVNK